MSLWNVAGVLQSPYGILKNSYTPILPTIKAVYCWESLAILTCQKPDFKSIVEKKRVPTIGFHGLLHPGKGVRILLSPAI